MELCTAEEVHVLCLFPTLEDALAFDRYVYQHLLPVENKPELFGRQLLMDEEDPGGGRGAAAAHQRHLHSLRPGL